MSDPDISFLSHSYVGEMMSRGDLKEGNGNVSWIL